MKIGITLNTSFKSFFSNGHIFNVYIWYSFLTNCGFDCYFLIDKKEVSFKLNGGINGKGIDGNINMSSNNYKYLNFNELYNTDDNNERLTLKSDYKEQYPELLDFDFVFFIGTYDFGYHEILNINNIKVIYVVLGNVFMNDVQSLVYDCKVENVGLNLFFNEVWISPHFKFSKEYCKIRYKSDNVFICPYFWKDDLLINGNNNIKCKPVPISYNLPELKLSVAIMEPNINHCKNALIPICICEKAEKYIKYIKIFNTEHKKENVFLKPFLMNTELFKNGKLTVESRWPITHILSNYCNCVISFVDNCDLNYVYFECFYLGVPLIHNSVMLKDYGYYYPNYDINKGAEQIFNVLHNHNKEEYIKKHKPLLEKYSIYNPSYIAWTKARLNNNISYDCE
tara:strand:+ start:88 stop:1275 length:1188 start_codon:yes stop_codon:yes gene_type:complete